MFLFLPVFMISNLQRVVLLGKFTKYSMLYILCLTSCPVRSALCSSTLDIPTQEREVRHQNGTLPGPSKIKYKTDFSPWSDQDCRNRVDSLYEDINCQYQNYNDCYSD